MKGLFPFLEKNDALTAVRKSKTPSDAAYAASILMLSELIKVSEQMRQQQEQAQIARRLKRVGLTEAYVAARQTAYTRGAEMLGFMLDMWRDLGTHTLLVRLDDFRAILRRHDLMCNRLDNYFGDVPTEKIAEIEKAHYLQSEDGMERYFLPVQYPSASYCSSYEEYIEMMRFPHSIGGRDFFQKTDRSKCYANWGANDPETLFIAAPKRFMAKVNVHREVLVGSPAYDITERAEREGYINVKTSHNPYAQPLPYNYDPFVCSACKHGIIIHSMWGAEAEDATIKRYQELRDAIIGNATPAQPNISPLLLN